jgi:hypothetical protein
MDYCEDDSLPRSWTQRVQERKKKDEQKRESEQCRIKKRLFGEPKLRDKKKLAHTKIVGVQKRESETATEEDGRSR